MACLETQFGKGMGQDSDVTSKPDEEEQFVDEESFVQVKRNLDDDNAEAGEMACVEAQLDKRHGSGGR